MIKDEIRFFYKTKRSEMTKDEVEIKSNKAMEHFLSSEVYNHADSIMLYMPLKNEVNVLTIMHEAIKNGKQIVICKTDTNNGEMTPFYVDENTNYKKGAFSVLEPCGAVAADASKIDLVLVPGIVFSSSGGRVGFGKGCYDKFLPTTSAIKIGVCYAFQICDELAEDEHDVDMDYLLTEKGIIKCK